MIDDPVDNLLERVRVEVFPRLDASLVSMIEVQLRFEGNVCMAIDDALQYALSAGVTLSPDLLDEAEAAVEWWWDPDVTAERTHGVIDQYRRQMAAA